MDPGFILELIAEYKYLLIAPAAFLFGPPVSLATGVLLRIDALSLIPTCLALVAGELGGDVLWYWLGKRYGDSFSLRFGRYAWITEKSIASTKELFSKHHDIILFTSKLTAGLGIAPVVLFTAGLSHVPFRRYMMLNIAGQFLWTAGLLSAGYLLGHVYLEISGAFEKIALIAFVGVLLASLLGFGRYLRGYIIDASPGSGNQP